LGDFRDDRVHRQGSFVDKEKRAHVDRLVKWRNQLLALLCLFAFAGLGVLYFQHWVVQKPFAIILFVGEGLAPHQLAATRLYVGGADARLALDSMSHVALLMNASNDFAVPDEAAAATALATGIKVNNRAIAVRPDGTSIPTLLELARARGRATGLVTDVKLTDPGCAAFYAHAPEGSDAGSIAAQLGNGQKIDIVMGGGGGDFVGTTKGGSRQDDRDLLLEMRGDGFDLVTTRVELEAIPAWRRAKVFGAFATGALAFQNQLDERKDQPTLSDMVRRAIELLQYNARGYVLVVHAGLMGSAARNNNAEQTLSETAELDRAVAVARRYAGERSTIIVCGDVAIGGMAINGSPFRKDSGIALLGLNSAGQPWITWASGPNGLRAYGAAKLADKPAVAVAPTSSDSHESEQLEPAALYVPSAFNTADDMIAVGAGPGTEALQGSIENTAVFRIIHDQL
jgi:alkaline phosphatase